MTLIIINKSPIINIYSIETYKNLVRKLIGKNRGPNGVTESIIRGLDELNYEYKLNPKIENISPKDTIWVNESIGALRWAIDFKKENNNLVVGPNLVIFPTDEEDLLCNPKIDTILQPSKWTKELMSSIKSELEDRIKIWPAGVNVPKERINNKDNDVLIYIKNNNTDILNKIEKLLMKKTLTFEKIRYGHFKQSEFFNKLDKSKALIYVAKSESQGLALQEAWARNVPTLVFDKGCFTYKNFFFTDEKISAPYINEQSGAFFTIDNFEDSFEEFWRNLKDFTPKEYVVKNLSDKVCAQKFLEIINNKYI